MRVDSIYRALDVRELTIGPRKYVHLTERPATRSPYATRECDQSDTVQHARGTQTPAADAVLMKLCRRRAAAARTHTQVKVGDAAALRLQLGTARQRKAATTHHVERAPIASQWSSPSPRRGQASIARGRSPKSGRRSVATRAARAVESRDAKTRNVS